VLTSKKRGAGRLLSLVRTERKRRTRNYTEKRCC
jgi:hypothetical protein